MTVTHLWSGAAGPTGFRVKGKVAGGSTRLAVSTSADLSSPVFFGPVTPTSDGIVDLTATGLANDTQYWYGFEVAGVLDTSIVGKAHTHKPVGTPYSFTFAAWACAGGTAIYPATGGLSPSHISNHPGFADIAAVDRLFNVQLGDMCYYNFGSGQFTPTPPTVSQWRDMYNTVLTQTNQAQVYRTAASVYLWDNHDYGQPAPQDTSSDGTFAWKNLSAQAYRERVPSYPLAEGQAIYHSFQVGRVLFVVDDLRYYRDATTAPAPRSCLGSAQLAWLDNLLSTKSTDPGIKALCWVISQPTQSRGGGSWGVFPEEREQLLGMFDTYGWTPRMFEIAGDQHQLGFDAGSASGHPVYTLAPMDSSSGGATGGYDIGTYADNTNRGQYGLITVEDAGGTFLRWTARGYSYSA